MTQLALTRRQRQILDYYRDYSAEHQISPTLEEVAANFGLNKVTIFGHVAELERKGALKRAARGISRGMQLVDEGDGTTIPILGSIAAGAPIATIEEPEALDLNSLIPADRDVYILRVSGNSMIDDAICDEDLVLVERRSDADDGDIVVAVLPDEEATLKRLFREKNGYRLQPANAAMEPIFVPEVEVRGVVIGVLRKYR